MIIANLQLTSPLVRNISLKIKDDASYLRTREEGELPNRCLLVNGQHFTLAQRNYVQKLFVGYLQLMSNPITMPHDVNAMKAREDGFSKERTLWNGKRRVRPGRRFG